MTNYPYNTTLLPAWPVKAACKPFKSATTQEQLAIAPFTTINMFYNKNETVKDFQFWNFTQSDVYVDYSDGKFIQNLKKN